MLKKILLHNWLAIFYFNFRMLSFQQAIKLPFDFYYKIRFENLTAKVILTNKNLYRGMIKIGGRGSEMFSRNETIIDLKGTLILKGVVEIGHGSLLRIEDSGIIVFGNHVRIGALSKIFCEESIVFGNEIDFSWECQIFDTNFHDVLNKETGDILKKTSPINIGSNNWFGSRVSVMKRTKTPDNFIVASNSLCNNDYRNVHEYSVFGGIPAKQIDNAKERVFESH